MVGLNLKPPDDFTLKQDRLSTLWRSDLSDKIKRDIFEVVATSVLLYGCTTWTLTKRLEKKLDGNWTRMLHDVFSTSWKKIGMVRAGVQAYPVSSKALTIMECLNGNKKEKDKERSV